MLFPWWYLDTTSIPEFLAKELYLTETESERRNIRFESKNNLLVNRLVLRICQEKWMEKSKQISNKELKKKKVRVGDTKTKEDQAEILGETSTYVS